MLAKPTGERVCLPLAICGTEPEIPAGYVPVRLGKPGRRNPLAKAAIADPIVASNVERPDAL
jgi:hypothetical protein